MDVTEDIKLGDLVPIYSRPFGKSWVRCMSIHYGVVIAFTNNNNPRACPLYYKQEQTFTSKDSFAWARKRSVIIPNAIPLGPVQKENYLLGGKRKKNYNRVMSAALQDIKKRTVPVESTGTSSYFTFD